MQARLFRASNYKTSRLRVLLCQSGVVFLVLMLSTAFSGICLAEDSGSASSVPVPEQKNDCANDELKWPLCVSEGPDDLFYFLEAVSGKKFKPKTFDLLHGVTDVTVENNVIVFHRVDKVELRLGHDTERGGKFFEDWEKAKINLEAKFGPSGRDFLDSVDRVHIAGERIEVIRKGAPDLVINLGDRKLHHAFDLRGLRFGRLSMLVDKAGEYPSLKDIKGVTAVINAPGFSFPVEVKEFGKIRLEKVNDIKVGVRNPVPSAMRTILFLPAILRFHFLLSRKD